MTTQRELLPGGWEYRSFAAMLSSACRDVSAIIPLFSSLSGEAFFVKDYQCCGTAENDF
jgi:hypothetical protein